MRKKNLVSLDSVSYLHMKKALFAGTPQVTFFP